MNGFSDFESPHIPIRTCLGCSRKLDKFALIRLVRVEQNRIKIDFVQRAEGRGAYICPNTTCIQSFIRKKRLRRLVPKLNSQNQQQLVKELKEIAMDNKVFSLTGLARKAGAVVVGQQAVLAALRRKQARLVVLAADAAPNTAKQIQEVCSSRGVLFFQFGAKDDWGKLFSKKTVAVLAVKHDGFARAITAEIKSINSK